MQSASIFVVDNVQAFKQKQNQARSRDKSFTSDTGLRKALAEFYKEE